MKVKRVIPMEVSFAFEQVMKLGGGENEYGDSTKAAIWSEVESNTEIQRLSASYLFGNSEKAQERLDRLQDKLRSIFFATAIENDTDTF
jgi:hypothetical protein